VAASVDALRPCRTIYVFPAAFIIGWAKRSASAKSRPIIRHADPLAGLFVATQDGSPLPDGTLVSIPEQTIGARSSTIRSARPLAVGIFTTCRRGRSGRSGSLLLHHFVISCAVPDDVAVARRLTATASPQQQCYLRSAAKYRCNLDTRFDPLPNIAQYVEKPTDSVCPGPKTISTENPA